MWCSRTRLSTRESWKKNGVFYPIRNRCQFSWFCDGKSDDPKEPTTYAKMLDIARDLVYDKMQIVDFTEGATHYHADYVFPEWRKRKLKQLRLQTIYFIGGKNEIEGYKEKVKNS